MKIGDTSEAEFRVEAKDSAAALTIGPEDSFPDVFATSRMVALMEIAAARLMKSELQADQHSVGVSVAVKHTAATLVGGQVRAVATYLGPDGKLFRFKVEAFDDAGPIGDGEHTRAMVSTARLMAGAAKRVPPR